MKRKIINIIEIIVLLFCIVLPFIKIYHGMGVLPGYDENGNFILTQHHYYYNILDNLKALVCSRTLAIIIVALLMELAFATIVLLVINFNKTHLATILFFVTVSNFIMLYLACSTVHWCY